MVFRKQPLVRIFCGKRGPVACAAIAGAAISTMACLPSANAALTAASLIKSTSALVPFQTLQTGQPGVVNAGDTFNIAVVGFNANGSGSYLTAAVDPVFGTTQTFTGDALGGQVLTVTSSETTSGGTTTDLITISVPTNFDPAGTTVGSPAGPVITMEADLGGYNAGTDTVDFSSNVSTATVTGFMTYSGGNFALSPAGNDAFTNGGLSLATAEGIGAGGSDLAAFNIHAFTFSISYPAAVPEPASGGILLSLAAASLLRRRRAR